MTIKTGDLVMVVRPAPCCGSAVRLGLLFIATTGKGFGVRCLNCGIHTYGGFFIDGSTGHGYLTSRLKKIDPPAEGDSLPTRADIEVPA